jgi:hypothetical protein
VLARAWRVARHLPIKFVRLDEKSYVGSSKTHLYKVTHREDATFTILDEYADAVALYEINDGIWSERATTFPKTTRVFASDADGDNVAR